MLKILRRCCYLYWGNKRRSDYKIFLGGLCTTMGGESGPARFSRGEACWTPGNTRLNRWQAYDERRAFVVVSVLRNWAHSAASLKAWVWGRLPLGFERIVESWCGRAVPRIKERGRKDRLYHKDRHMTKWGKYILARVQPMVSMLNNELREMNNKKKVKKAYLWNAYYLIWDVIQINIHYQELF